MARLTNRKRIFKSFDIETTGFNPRKDKIFSFCIGHFNGVVDVYRLDYDDDELNMKNWLILKEFFADTSIEKIAHNYKFELSFMLRSAMPIEIEIPKETIWHDTMIMSQMMRNLAPRHSLEHLSWLWFGYDMSLDKKVKTMGNVLGNYQRIPKNIMTPYQNADGVRPIVLFRMWWKDLINDKPLYKDYLNEIALIKASERMENYGLDVAVKEAKKLRKWCEKEFDKVVNDVRKETGEFMNFGSPKLLEKLLFETKGYPILSRTKTGNPSTDKEAILELRETYQEDRDFLDLIIKWRSYSVGVTTIQSYLDLRDDSDVIHPLINTNKAATGRESASKPNLQNVSKAGAMKNLYPVNSRVCFKARKGHTLYFVDYAGIEMRLIIDRSDETEMIQILKDGGDPHAIAAELFYSGLAHKDLCKKFNLESKIVSPKKMDKKEWKIYRGAGKNCHFSIPYGSSVANSARTLNLPEEVAQIGLDAYYERFPKIASFSRTVAKKIKENGFIITPFGRRLFVFLNKAYAGANYDIQGTAAGIIKRAQVRVDKYLRKNWNDEIRIVLPIHDEMLISIPDKFLKYEKKILSEISYIMTNIKEIKVPLEVEWKKTSTTWDKAEEVSYK